MERVYTKIREEVAAPAPRQEWAWAGAGAARRKYKTGRSLAIQ